MDEEDMLEEQNQDEIKQHLQHLEQEYQLPYTQRKHLHFSNLQEELAHFMQELNEREQACKAVAGIALFLMDEKDSLIENYKELENAKEKQEFEITQIQAQLEDRLYLLNQLELKLNQKQLQKNRMKSELEERDLRIRQYEDCIEELKQEHENLYAQYMQIEKEKEEKKKSKTRTSILLVQQTKHNNEKNELEDQIQVLKKEILQIEKNLQESRKLENL